MRVTDRETEKGGEGGREGGGGGEEERERNVPNNMICHYILLYIAHVLKH